VILAIRILSILPSGRIGSRLVQTRIKLDRTVTATYIMEKGDGNALWTTRAIVRDSNALLDNVLLLYATVTRC